MYQDGIEYCNICGCPNETCECTYEFGDFDIFDTIDFYHDVWEDDYIEEQLSTPNLTIDGKKYYEDEDTYCPDCGRSVELCDCESNK